MVERDGPDGVVKIEIILEGSVIALPPHHVVRAELTLALPNFSNIFVVDLGSFICTVHSSFLSSYQAVGLSKSPGLAIPLAPMGPSSGREK